MRKRKKDAEHEKLLLYLLLQPLKHPTRRQRLIALLSNRYWDGVGALLSFLSLIVTIILTFYIFNITKEQQTANMSYEPVLYALPSSNDVTIRQAIKIRNLGPATAENVLVTISSSRPLDCDSLETDEISDVSPIKIDKDDYHCKIFYDYFYRDSSSVVYLPDIAYKPNSLSSTSKAGFEEIRESINNTFSTILAIKIDVKVVISGMNTSFFDQYRADMERGTWLLSFFTTPTPVQDIKPPDS